MLIALEEILKECQVEERGPISSLHCIVEIAEAAIADAKGRKVKGVD